MFLCADDLKAPERQYERAFRQCITDVFKGMGAGISVAGTIQAGCVQPGDKVCVMPQGELANVRGECGLLLALYVCSVIGARH